MTERYVAVESYPDESDAEEDLEVLESCGFHVLLRETIDENSETGFIYTIDVPSSEADRAAQVLNEFAEAQDQELDFMH